MPKGKRASAAEGRPADYAPDWRPCLGALCDRKLFWSLGPGNRKCPKCVRAENEPRARLSRRQCGAITNTLGRG